jgi:hypothetical protein
VIALCARVRLVSDCSAHACGAHSQIPCAVVDPREVRLTSSQAFVLDHRRGVCGAVAPWIGRSPLACATHRKYQTRQVEQLHTLFDSTSILRSECSSDEATAIARAVHECSVIVGLHPDQALDHIVDVAVALHKPFAVVPCCECSMPRPQEAHVPTSEMRRPCSLTLHRCLLEARPQQISPDTFRRACPNL